MKPPTDSTGRYDDGVPHHTPGVHDELDNPDVVHEHRDVDLRAIGGAAAILAVVAIVAHVAMYLLLGWFERSAAAADRPASPLAVPSTQMPASTNASPAFSVGVTGPQLLTNEPMALDQHRTSMEQRLSGYGWVDQNAGVAHIPIQEEKKLIIDRGLPVREGAAAPSFAVRTPARGEPSGGRAVTVALPEPPAEDAKPAETPQPEAAPHGQGH